ncbi:hypothetical protein TrRE_jg10298, partial [Triparma retinervis]
MLFANDRRLLEVRGSLVIRKLCVLLNAKSVYMEASQVVTKGSDFSLEFISTMVQTLNLILPGTPKLLWALAVSISIYAFGTPFGTVLCR